MLNNIILKHAAKIIQNLNSFSISHLNILVFFARKVNNIIIFPLLSGNGIYDAIGTSVLGETNLSIVFKGHAGRYGCRLGE